MPAQPPKDDETIDALKLLSGGSGSPPARSEHLRSTPQAPPPGRVAASASASSGTASPASPKVGPLPEHYRCLRCGYRLAGAPSLRCPECGAENDLERLEAWFDGAEQGRFDLVIWLILAGLFLRLLLLPDSHPGPTGDRRDDRLGRIPGPE